MTGSRFFAEHMRGYGVSHIFFVPTILTPALAEMEDMGITRVTTHGEKAAAYMADGYARASGRPGVCMAQTVGAANLAAGLRDARMAGSPVIAITGGRSPQYKHRYVYQEVVDLPMFEPVTKWNAQVDAVERLPDMLRQAFRSATSGAPGPVHLELQGNHGEVVQHEADLELIVEERFTRFPAFRPEPEAQAIRDAARLLAEARRPIIVAGGGVAFSGAGAELVELAEKLSIPVVTSLHAKGTISEEHPLAVGVAGTYSRRCANQAVSEADLVFFVGSHAGGQVTHFWRVPSRGTRVIQLDVDPEELGRNYPNAVSIVGDAKVSLRRLVDAATPGSQRGEWLRRVQGLVADWRTEVEPMRSSDAVPMRPERVCREIADALPADAVVVSDTGHSGMWTGALLDLTKPTQKYIRCAGSLGWAFSAALGAKSALPDRPVVCFSGDGGFYYHMAEMETAVRFGINAVIVVNNNGALNQEEHLFDEAYGGQQPAGGKQMWNFREVNFANIANEMGCLGIRVERPDELPGALQRALGANRPVILDVVTDVRAMATRAWAPGAGSGH